MGGGINLGNALESPHEGDWGVVLQPEYFSLIKAAGFSHVRLPVCWSAHAMTVPPYTIEPAFIERVAWAISQARKNGLLIVVDMHHYHEFEQSPDSQQQRFDAMWQQIAQRFSNEPEDMAFELYNEPCKTIDAAKWNQIAAQTLHLVRQSNAQRFVVIGPANWNSISQLPELSLPESDSRLIVTVHYYNPFHFTHQGASWVGQDSVQWLGTKWLGTAPGVSAIAQDLDSASKWGNEHDRPIYLGEFGAFEKADMESRARWTQTVRELAAQRGMATAYWEFCSGFGAYDPQSHHWREPLLKALQATK
jgi:endoglucanase